MNTRSRGSPSAINSDDLTKHLEAHAKKLESKGRNLPSSSKGGGELIERAPAKQTKKSSIPIPDSNESIEPEVVKIEKKARKSRKTDGEQKPRGTVEADKFRCNKCRSNQDATGVKREEIIQKSGRKQAVLKGQCKSCGTKVAKFVKND